MLRLQQYNEIKLIVFKEIRETISTSMTTIQGELYDQGRRYGSEIAVTRHFF